MTDPAVVEEEAGRMAIGTYLQVPPGQTSLTYAWTSPYAANVDTTGGTYRLTLQAQPGTIPEPLNLTIRAPDGYRITAASPGLAVSGGVATLATAFDRDIVVGVHVRDRERCLGWLPPDRPRRTHHRAVIGCSTRPASDPEALNCPLAASSRPMARHAVAAGDGAFRTWRTCAPPRSEVLDKRPIAAQRLGPNARRPPAEVSEPIAGVRPGAPDEEPSTPVANHLGATRSPVTAREAAEPGEIRGQIRGRAGRSRGAGRPRAQTRGPRSGRPRPHRRSAWSGGRRGTGSAGRRLGRSASRTSVVPSGRSARSRPGTGRSGCPAESPVMAATRSEWSPAHVTRSRGRPRRRPSRGPAHRPTGQLRSPPARYGSRRRVPAARRRGRARSAASRLFRWGRGVRGARRPAARSRASLGPQLGMWDPFARALSAIAARRGSSTGASRRSSSPQTRRDAMGVGEARSRPSPRGRGAP